MPDHRLHNVRPIPPSDAMCHGCDLELFKVADLADIITPRPGMTFCGELCYSEWVVEYGGTNPPKIDDRRADAPLLRARATERDAALAAHRRQVIADTVAWQAANRGHSDKSIARQTGEAAANVVGFLIWIIAISAIAAVIFAVIGIDSGL